jgi:hypothetical protein
MKLAYVHAMFTGAFVLGPCKRAPDPPPAPMTTTTTPAKASASGPTCDCAARQVCVRGRCVHDSVDYRVGGIALGAPAFACALYANGEVWCAGKNTVGQLGNGKPPLGDKASDEPPARVAGIAAARMVVAGPQHACALVDKAAWCWGNGSSTPSRVAGLGEVQFLSAGRTRTCAVVDKDASVACWGADRIAKPVKGVTGVYYVGIGDDRSCALVITNRTIACWGADRVASTVPDLIGMDDVTASDKFACARDILGPAFCWGGRFGAKPSRVPFLDRASQLSASGDLVCGIGQGVVRCSDTKSNYTVTLGDSGSYTPARLLAVSGTFTMNVHSDDDVVDADDELAGKRVFDMLGQTAPRAEIADVREAKGIKPPPPQPVGPSVLSCDARTVFGTCTEYSNGSGGSGADTRCRQSGGSWSSSACSRQNVLGICVIGTDLDRGAKLVIYDTKDSKGVGEARAMCVGGFDGRFSTP